MRPWCQYFIDATISFEGKTWRFSGIYGETKQDQRRKTWEAIRFLLAQDDLPCLCAGDFNEVTRAQDQLGRNPRNESNMQAFRECLS
jgi:hypothetical protein